MKNLRGIVVKVRKKNSHLTKHDMIFLMVILRILFGTDPEEFRKQKLGRSLGDSTIKAIFFDFQLPIVLMIK
jgi:hypothetical protein